VKNPENLFSRNSDSAYASQSENNSTVYVREDVAKLDGEREEDTGQDGGRRMAVTALLWTVSGPAQTSSHHQNLSAVCKSLTS